jgi:hypothetical protein
MKLLGNFIWVSCIGALVLSSGCSPKSDDFPDDNYTPSATSQALTALYQSDVNLFPSISSTSIATFDQGSNNNQLFQKIFGGETGDDVVRYYQQRVHHAYTQEQMDHAKIAPGSFPTNGWAIIKPEAGTSGTSTGDTILDDTNPNIKIGAINISTMLWLQGEVNRSKVTLFVGDDTISVDSTRVGVILLDTGYTPTVTDSSGGDYNIPALRQAILVHEARHSDCTGGLSSETLSIMREASSSQEFSAQEPRNYCGHTHVVCPLGLYEGLSACDSEQFGAYTVGAIYESALIDSMPDDTQKGILRTSAIDYFSRYVDLGAPSNEDETTPNMTSSDTVN